MPNNFTIRQMQIGDLHDVYHVQTLGFTEDLWESTETFKQILTDYPSGSFVAEVGGNIVAYILSQPADETREDFDTGHWEIRGDEECLYLHDLCLSPDVRGTGIAQALVDQLGEYAKNKFKKIVGISVQDTQKFWTKRGFIMHHECGYLTQSGTFMTKILEQN